MRKLFQVLPFLLPFYVLAANAVDVDEQSRRCNIEKNSLKNPKNKEGAECLKLRAMLGLPEPPVVNNYYGGNGGGSNGAPRRVFDAQGNRWCTIYPNGPIQCD